MQGDEFHAKEILAKHDEAYMPPEVKAAMDKAKAEGQAPPVETAHRGDQGLARILARRGLPRG